MDLERVDWLSELFDVDLSQGWTIYPMDSKFASEDILATERIYVILVNNMISVALVNLLKLIICWG